MSEARNMEQVRRIFAAFERGDIDDILGRLADDVRFVSHVDAAVPWAGEFTGKTNVAKFFQALGGSVEVTEHPVTAVIAQGDTVVATGDVRFRVRESGKAGSSSWVYIFRLDDGRVRTYDQFNDGGLAEAFA